MLSLPYTVCIFAYSQPTDMRKSCDGLAAIVSHQLSRNLLLELTFGFSIDP